MSDVNQLHLRLMEALLFASANPIPEPVMAERLPDGADIPELLETLQEQYKERGVHLVKVNKAWAFRTAPDLGPQLIVEREVTRKLSRAAVETLAIIAYHQPITRAEIEEIRGVGLSKGTMDVLFEAGWIRPRGRRRSPGKPVTWGTSDKFLDQFGLENLDDLPGMEDLKAAGLLDKRPAIQALGARGSLGTSTPVYGEPGEDSDEEVDLPEPLDPDDGEISVPSDMY